ncbi:MAG: hypothetical protein ACKO0V_24320, partial [bacterium]
MSSAAGFGRFLPPTAILLSSFFTSVSSVYGWQAGEQAQKAEAVAASPKQAAAAPTTQEQIDALMKLVRSQ